MSARFRGNLPDGADGRPTWADVQRARDAALAATDPRWHWSVERVYAAVKALAEAGTGTLVSVGTVGDWCVEKGGPGAASIRNNPRLVGIVQVAASTRKFLSRAKHDGAVEHAILEALGDPELRSALIGLLAHRRLLIVENTNLRAAATRLSAISFLSREMAEADIGTLAELASAIGEARLEERSPTFDAHEVAACRRFLDTGMSQTGLMVDKQSGEIIDRVQRTVAEQGVASALAKVAASVSMVGVDAAVRLRELGTNCDPAGH